MAEDYGLLFPLCVLAAESPIHRRLVVCRLGRKSVRSWNLVIRLTTVGKGAFARILMVMKPVGWDRTGIASCFQHRVWESVLVIFALRYRPLGLAGMFELYL